MTHWNRFRAPAALVALVAACAGGDQAGDGAQSGSPVAMAARSSQGFTLVLSDSASAGHATTADSPDAAFCRQSARIGTREIESLRLTLNSEQVALVATASGAPLGRGELAVGTSDSRIRVRVMHKRGASPADWRLVTATSGRVVLNDASGDRLRGGYELTFVDQESGTVSTLAGAFNAQRSSECGVPT